MEGRLKNGKIVDKKEREIIRVAIVHNENEKTAATVERLLKLLDENNIIRDDENPEVVISVGGDGTLLSAFHQYSHQLQHVQFLGVHTGHLGFYTDWRDYELEDMVASLKDYQKQEAITYPLLDVCVTYKEDEKEVHYFALNESTIRRIGKTMVADVFVKGELFESFRGDSLSVSTPTGSTALNKSIGGAILHPSIRGFQVTEIASLNNIVFRTLGSAMIIGEDGWVKIELKEDSNYYLTVDQLELSQRKIASISYRLAKEEISFVATRHTPFFTRVKDAFIGEV